MTDFRLPARGNSGSVLPSSIKARNINVADGIAASSMVDVMQDTKLNNGKYNLLNYSTLSPLSDYDDGDGLESTLSFEDQLLMLNRRKHDEDFLNDLQIRSTDSGYSLPTTRSQSLKRKRSADDQQIATQTIDLYELARSVQPDCSYKLEPAHVSSSAITSTSKLDCPLLLDNDFYKGLEGRNPVLSASPISAQSSHLRERNSNYKDGRLYNMLINSNGVDKVNTVSSGTTDNHNSLANDEIEKQQIASLTAQTTISDPISIFISNIVTILYTGCTLNLRDIAMNGFNVIFRRSLNKVTMMNRKPYGFANIWSSGKIACTGATSVEDARKLSRRVARCVQKIGFPVRFCNYRVVNVFAHCNMPFQLDLSSLYKHARKADFVSSILYEPELNPGATIKIGQLRVTIKAFSTGSITVIGPTVCSLETGCQMIYPIMRSYARL
ncbi:hypothetical protein GJ496_007441 [Pomphorhynchus laevis]|nr:hypothetical protein GJ496_007441 [Pomphorhynchus laevis]